MKSRLTMSLLLSLGFFSGAAFAAEDSIDRAALLKAVDRLEDQYSNLEGEITRLKRLLGVDASLQSLKPLAPDSDKLKSKVVRKVKDGIQAFEDEDYAEAKSQFQSAWEDAPESKVTNYNLGVLYQKQGKPTLAKRFFKVALEIDPKVPEAEDIKRFLSGEEKKDSDSELSSEEKQLRNELTNLKKEANSFMHSKTMPLPKRRAETVAVLRQMVEKAQDSKALQKEYLLDVADAYRVFELFDDAIALYDQFEEAMSGEVLPDGYYSRRLQVEERRRELEDTLESYLGNSPSEEIRRHVERSQQELEIFASQMDEFVNSLSEDDNDFKNITKRLADFRWGSKTGRHVLIVNRFEELVYSNLKGTLPIDRYQDTKGRAFLQHITRLADRLELKQVEFVEVDLSVNNAAVPYVIFFTYVPKHESFIILRIPKADLA